MAIFTELTQKFSDAHIHFIGSSFESAAVAAEQASLVSKIRYNNSVIRNLTLFNGDFTSPLFDPHQF